MLYKWIFSAHKKGSDAYLRWAAYVGGDSQTRDIRILLFVRRTSSNHKIICQEVGHTNENKFWGILFIFKTILDPRVLLKEVSYVSKFNLTQHFGSDLRLKNLRSYTSLLIANDTIEIVHPSFLSTFFYSTLKVNIYNIMCFSIFLSTIIQTSLAQYTFGFLRNQQMQ